MSQLQIVCNNCGAKYRLPDTFQGDQAKCKQCGSVIDVKAQRQSAGAGAAAAAPAAARPAAARPATTRPAREPAEKPAGRERPARTGRRHGGGDKAEAAAVEGHGRHRHGHGHEEKKSNTGLMIGSGIALLAVIAVGVIWYTSSGSDKPAETPAAQQPEAGKGGDGKQAAKPKDASADKGTPKPQDASAGKTPEPTPAPSAPEAGKQPEAPKPAAQPPVEPVKVPDAPPAEPLPADAPAWMRKPMIAMDKVFDPRKLPKLAWPAAVPEEQQKHVVALLDDIQGGGTTGIRAKRELEKLGWASLTGIVNRLCDLDYSNSEDAFYAWELNKILDSDSMFVGLNAGFTPVKFDEAIDPRQADWNARTAEQWRKLVASQDSQEKFEALRKKRLEDKKDKK